MLNPFEVLQYFRTLDGRQISDCRQQWESKLTNSQIAQMVRGLHYAGFLEGYGLNGSNARYVLSDTGEGMLHEGSSTDLLQLRD